MSQFDQLPYFRDYLEQILRPRVAKHLEEIRSALTESVWHELLARMGQEQGISTDAAGMQKLRSMLEEGLNLRLTAHIVGSLEGPGVSTGNGHAAEAGREEATRFSDTREGVVDAGFPNNPLARAVGQIRKTR
jgi:hypothetical protein